MVEKIMHGLFKHNYTSVTVDTNLEHLWGSCKTPYK